MNNRKTENEQRARLRKQKLLQDHHRNKALQEKRANVKDKLSQEHLITSAAELYKVLSEIDSGSGISSSKKKSKKLQLLRTQINIRKKILHQQIAIVFTQSRRQRPFDDIARDLAE